MILQSQLFGCDPKLEAAALSDPAHIVPGASGDHVRKIQLALIRLDKATIVPDGVYGRATAAAVLAYKQKRNIINRSYQTKADNIVGKMTIAALDKEMLEAELKPVWLQPMRPVARFPIYVPLRGPLLAFNIAFPGLLDITDLRPIPVRPFPAPGPDLTQEEVIIAQGNIGTIRVVDGSGGTLVRSQVMHFYGGSNNFFQVAQLRGAKTPGKNFEEIDIPNDDVNVTYDALNCGETFFQARVSPPQPPQKLSNIMRLLSLVDRSVTLPLPPGDYSPEPRLKSGLVSKAGTPLNPKPGRKINIFGEGESAGFEDYSSDIDFCSHTFSNGNGPPGATTGHRPWTADPRKPPGIDDHSVDNICCRGSPISPVTIDEILRIGGGKCRVTYAEAEGRKNCDRLRAGLKGATVIDEGNFGTTGRAIVLELV
ncbi:MAG: peptidoglycan-binding protein [Verrucomicrobia bacterium]|nr:peptidoglycan-binding protein [Verrucomicrobiota bacterium]